MKTLLTLIAAATLLAGCTTPEAPKNVDTGVTNTAPSTSPSANGSPASGTANDSTTPPR